MLGLGRVAPWLAAKGWSLVRGQPEAGRMLDEELSGIGFRDVFEASPDAMVLADADGRTVLVNAGVERLFGYQRDEVVGQPVEVLIPDRFRQRHAAYHADFVAHPRTRPMVGDLDVWGRRKDGSEFPVEIALSPLSTSDGVFVFAAIRDVGHLRLAERLASQARAVIESSHDAIIATDIDGVVSGWNPGAERLSGYSAQQATGRSISMLLPSPGGEKLAAALRRVLAGERVDDDEMVLVGKDGRPVSVSVTVAQMRDRAGNVIGASTIARDISPRVRQTEQLVFEAEHDPLTGVCNRRRFEQDLGTQLQRARRYGEHTVVVLIDVDGFKAVNDRHGHPTGDEALKGDRGRAHPAGARHRPGGPHRRRRVRRSAAPHRG